MFKKSVAFLGLAVTMLFLLPAAILLYCFITSPSTAVIFGCGIVVGYFLKRNKKAVQEQLKEAVQPVVTPEEEDDDEDDSEEESDEEEMDEEGEDDDKPYHPVLSDDEEDEDLDEEEEDD